jgi:hypothetical protein
LRNVVSLATLLVGLSAAVVQAQELQPLKAWSTLQEGSAGLVLMVDANVNSFFINTPDKKFIDSGKWFGGELVRQFRVPPGEYRILLPELGASLGVNAQEGSLTYIRLSPYTSDGGDAGGRITTWRGAVPGNVAGLLAVAFSKGIPDAYKTPLFDAPAKTLLVSTTPPWAPPPPPPPPKK